MTTTSFAGRASTAPSSLRSCRESSVVGSVRDSVADDLNIGRGVPVVTGLPDYATAAAGSGAVGPGEAHVMISTTSWISCPIAAKKTNVLNEVTTGFGATHGEYVVLNNIDTAGACLDWFRRIGLGLPPDPAAPPMASR